MPTRLHLRPDLSILRLPDGTVQVGLDVETPVLFPDAPPHAETALRRLRRGCTSHEFEQVVPGLPRRWAREALRTLTHAGFAGPERGPAAIPVVLGTGVLAEAVRAALPLGTPLIEPRAWRPERHPGKLVLVCPDTPEPDRVLTRELTVVGRPHLIVRAEPERTIVGPFVSAESACVTCTDLIRRDLEPAWPHLLLQMCRSHHVPGAGQAAWAAGTAEAQVRAWAAGIVPDAWGTTLELGVAEGTLGTRHWARRPDCAAHARADRAAA